MTAASAPLDRSAYELVSPRTAPSRSCGPAAWSPAGADLLVDDRVVRSVRQRIAYPLQLTVDLFVFPAGPDRPAHEHPGTGEVRRVRGWRRAVT